MKITRDTIEELGSVLQDLEAAVSDITDPVETWLDEDADREARADARAQIETDVDGLADACVEVLKIVNPKVLA